ncbi:MAG: YitT family protein [Erysipelotrichaceae bacterium]|nr:YitT family protein [Erysipelotrichaceae bacterium]
MKVLENVHPVIKDYVTLILGSILFVVGVNVFIVPIGIYNGGIIGTSQLIRTLLYDILKISFKFDIAGIINMGINIPLLYMAYKNLSRKFFFGTLISVVLQTIFFTIVPIPKSPILDDMLSNIIIGAIISGAGCGIVLLSGASTGGLDIIGVYSSIKKSNFSVGGLSMIINFFIYATCAVLFDVGIAIYSIIYSTIASMAMDYFHYQNIEISLMVFTKNKEVKDVIMKKFMRGVTYWEGYGAYTNTDLEVMVTVCSKLESIRIKKMIQELDPQAFIIMNSTKVTGGFEKRLV